MQVVLTATNYTLPTRDLKHTAIISLYSINRLDFTLQTQCYGPRKKHADILHFIPTKFSTKRQLQNFYWTARLVVGRDSSVGTATRYGLDSPGIKSRWEARFPAPV
jgi:hypothetical protein